MKTFIHSFTDTHAFGTYIDHLGIDFSDKILVQIYAHCKDYNELKNIHRAITSKLPNSQIIGTVSDTSTITLDFDTSNTTIIFSSFEQADFRVFAHELTQDADALYWDIAHLELTSHSKLAVIFANIDLNACDHLLKVFNKAAPNLIIAGGIIPSFQSEKLYANDTFLEKGIVGFILDGSELLITARSNIHYMPIGRSHIVTGSCGNVIETIDYMPAKDFYAKYLGDVDFVERPEIGYTFPLLIHHGDRYLPKPILSINDCGEIVTNTEVSVGKTISLGYGSAQTMLENNKHSISSLKGHPCESSLIFNGLYRHSLTRKSVRYRLNEMAPPTYGFYTQSEFVTDDFESFVSVGNMQVVLISETPHKLLDTPLALITSYETTNTEEMLLLRLIKNTTRELNTLNHTLESAVLEKTNELLEHYYLDDLTKLPNHNKLTESLSRDQIKSLALIDISSFININNFYGNFIGNKLLSELAKLITAFCQERGYTTYRVHADIFAITCEGCEVDGFNNNIHLLQTCIHQHCFMELSLEIYITTVVSVSHNRYHLYENTSMTLEYAKGHKTPFLIYNPALKIEDSIKNNLIWTTKIRTAIEKNKIVPYFQPIYDNLTGEKNHFEVLMRLIDEDGLVITPNHFLPIAKRANLYKQLTKIIIAKAFEHFKDTNYCFSINLSSDDIIDEDVRNFIYEKLAAYPKSHHVTFEIVESEGIENYDEVKSFIQFTKTYGVKIAIDDFGTGFSNFHYLFKLNVDSIKIDGSIIQQIIGEKAASLVAETIVDFARKMGIATVAEFVSDEAIFNKTNELGINFSQGYYVARPDSKTDY